MSEFTSADHAWMSRTLRLAERGLYSTDPNPRVGCVLVRDGELVGQGWHVRAGGPHAEIEALAEAGDRARGATAYVSLEPCCHHGRTGPCAEALIEAGVSRVVAALEDPFPEVAGRGLARLREAGIATTLGLLAEQAEELNVGFLSRIRRGRPFLRVKLAASLDGRTALPNGISKWITSEEARSDVQVWRARASAIMTGIGTVRADDPQLDVRIKTPRQPARIVVDPGFSLSSEARLLSRGGPVFVIGSEEAAVPDWYESREVEAIPVPRAGDGLDLAAALKLLAARGMNEIHVEAGAILCGALLEARLVDELVLYLAPRLLGPGRGLFEFTPLESMDRRINLAWHSIDRIGPDLRIRARPEKPESQSCSPD
ncbi:MAG: bifunctional diaminohydroxyphosphoribosylaminopyrimidine deaminase/5-amino-6-(5-phosphoribosylamino)uracil reductase RibD [Xanthomonadales bacterium]|nr:bifunctional diaminohydroxyphosphoribosylaminopyrimidine deaminase/5-amino-6-(5-phosphoribosylamino)uracil reductase RibD [Xanthomonadales bacterium]